MSYQLINGSSCQQPRAFVITVLVPPEHQGKFTHIYELVPAQPLPGYRPLPTPLSRILPVHPRLRPSSSLSYCMCPCKTVPTGCQLYNTSFIPTMQCLQPPQSSNEYSGFSATDFRWAPVVWQISCVSRRESGMVSTPRSHALTAGRHPRDIKAGIYDRRFGANTRSESAQCHQISPPRDILG